MPECGSCACAYLTRMNVCVPLMRKFLWQYITLLNKEESDDEEEDISHIWRKHILKH